MVSPSCRPDARRRPAYGRRAMSTLDHSAQAHHGPTGRRRRRRRLMLAGGSAATLVAAGLTAVILAPPASAATPTPPPGFTLTWADNFDGASGSGMDTSV